MFPWAAWFLFTAFFLSAPGIAFAVASSRAFVRMKRYKAWCTWPPVLSGPLFIIGEMCHRFAAALSSRGDPEYFLDTLMECVYYSRLPYPPSFAYWLLSSIGAWCLMQTVFVVFVRLVCYMQPSGPDGETAKMARHIKAGYMLLGSSGLVVLFSFWPMKRYFSPFLELPFCLYLVGSHFLWKGRIADWAEQKQKTSATSEDAATPPWRGLFNATWHMSIILMFRSVYGIETIIDGWFYNSTLYHFVGNVILPLACYIPFLRHHPGMYLPQEFTVLLYREEAEMKYDIGLENA